MGWLVSITYMMDVKRVIQTLKRINVGAMLNKPIMILGIEAKYASISELVRGTRESLAGLKVILNGNILTQQI